MAVFFFSLLMPAFCSAESLRLASAGVWEVMEAGNLPDANTKARPTVRYGAGAAWMPGLGFVVTHGYRFDHRASRPAWFADTWVFDTEAARWTESKIRSPSETRPNARYKGAAAVVASPTGRPLFAFVGGDDGGHERSAQHIWGAYSNKVHFLDPDTEEWEEAVDVGGHDTFRPRQGHTATTLSVAGTQLMVVFGGLVVGRSAQGVSAGESSVDAALLADSNRLFVFDPAARTFRDLTPAGVADAAWETSDTSEYWPPPRRGHGACVLGSRMYVFGGFSKADGRKNLDDLWVADVGGEVMAASWTRVEPKAGGRWPTGRGGHGMVCDGELGVVVVHGGAYCAPGCTCNAEVWTFEVASGKWTAFEVERGMVPMQRHYHSVVLDPVRHDLYVFGGESYKPYAYLNDVWRLSLVGREPDERRVDASLLYDGLPLKSLMGRAGVTEEELRDVRPPEYRHHDLLVAEHKEAEVKTELQRRREGRLIWHAVKLFLCTLLPAALALKFLHRRFMVSARCLPKPLHRVS